MYTPPALITRRRIKRFNPVQLGKMLGVLYALMGLVAVPFILLLSALSSQMPQGQGTGMMAVGVGFALFIPFLYGIAGFIFGIIGALIYNLVAKWIGGIEVEVE